MDVALTSGFIQTVLGPIAPLSLGRTDAHEHLFLRTPALPGEEFDDVDLMVEELANVRRSGIETVVDLTPIGLGRAPSKQREVARRSGVNVVAATGYHRDAHYPAGHWIYRETDEVLLDVILKDLQVGMDERDWQGPMPRLGEGKAGIIKLGASYQRITGSEGRRIEVGSVAARRTGAPVAVHCEVGTVADDILDLFVRCGVSPDRVLLAHMDRNADPALHAELAGRGAYLLYDTVGRVKYRPESALVDLVDQVVRRGHGDRILLGTDVGRRSMLRASGGGPGMDVLGGSFLPRLRNRIGDEAVDAIVRTNAARALTINPNEEQHG